MNAWSAPVPGHTIAELTAGTTIHPGPSVAGIVEAIMRGKEADREAIAQAGQTAIKGVAGYMQQRKTDQMAQTLLDQASNYDNPTPTDTEAIARALNESEASPSDAWKAFNQTRTLDLKAATEESRAAHYDAMAEKLGRPAVPRGTTKKDPWEGMIPVARGKLDKDGNFTNAYAEAASGDQVKLATPSGKTLIVPFASYQAKTGAAVDSQGGGEDISTALEQGPAAIASQSEVVRVTKDGRRAVFDATTKQFLRYADSTE